MGLNNFVLPMIIVHYKLYNELSYNIEQRKNTNACQNEQNEINAKMHNENKSNNISSMHN